LIAISNRTAFGTKSKAGGLAVAVWDALKSSQGVWMGWSGKIYDFPSTRFSETEQDGVDFALCNYTKTEYEDFYLGYSNSVLWPVFHGRVDLAKFDDKNFKTYVEINKRFAENAVNMADTNDIIWVHDYHFLLVAKFLRDMESTLPCGFFLHIPFPSPDAFRSIPDHKLLIEGLISYDVIGLQGKRDVANLKMYLEREMDATPISDTVLKIGEREVKILHCPIGIDVKSFEETSTGEAAEEARDRLSKFQRNRSLVLGVDRMDYSKGLPQRFEGMAKFFDDYPGQHGKVSFTQVAPPSREMVDEYMHLREKLDALAGRINGDYGDLDWIPIRYLARGYAREEVAGLYRLAEVCLVTPLQDGMNLVAKEFIAAQDPQDPGVLVLSQFAGAAEQMKDALLVNPHSPSEISNAVAKALAMPLIERKKRWQSLHEGICSEDISWWRERFLTALKTVSVN
jgi:trehalose 6-phosphate synthase